MNTQEIFKKWTSARPNFKTSFHDAIEAMAFADAYYKLKLSELSERNKSAETSDKHETEQLNILGVVRSFSENDIKKFIIKLRKKQQDIDKEMMFLQEHKFNAELECQRKLSENTRKIINEMENEFDVGFVWDDSLDS